jgi:hypothetical protein
MFYAERKAALRMLVCTDEDLVSTHVLLRNGSTRMLQSDN